MRYPINKPLLILFAFAASLAGRWDAPLGRAEEPSGVRWQLTRSLPADEAVQAAAANATHLFAITNTRIGKYDRNTGKRVATSSGPASHLNSGFFWRGRLLAAHSNYPAAPEKSQIMQLDVETMQLTLFHDFKDYGGSLTWVLYKDDYWWCHFAKYGSENAGSFLVQLTPQWEEIRRWTLPPGLIGDLGQYSLSGGVWFGDLLYVTGHDARMLYRLRVPEDADVLQWIDSEPAPFSGQGIAIDPATPDMMIGIDRPTRRLLFAARQPPDRAP